MLRLFVFLLLLANGAYFVWSQGLLRAYGWAPTEQSEPQRVAQQIRPQAIVVLNAEEAKRVDMAALIPPRPAECLQAGPFSDAQLPVLRRALESNLPNGSWALEPALEAVQWIIYMGRYPNAEALAKKRSELIKLGFSPEPLLSPALEPGLSLGGFESQKAATDEMAALQKKGLRTARVIQEKAATRGTLLRIPLADETIRTRLEDIKIALSDKSLKSCKK